jgi:hypothetical protein
MGRLSVSMALVAQRYQEYLVPLKMRTQLWAGYFEQQVYDWHRAWLDKKGYIVQRGWPRLILESE